MNFFRVLPLLFLFTVVLRAEDTMFGKVKTLPKHISPRLDELWHIYKVSHNKTYTCKEEPLRRKIWERHLIWIYDHNVKFAIGHHSYSVRDNPFADLSTRRYNKDLVKLTPSRRRRVSDNEMVAAVLHDRKNVPPSFDWREQGLHFPTIDQLDCGSCYAYSITSSIQGQIFKQKKEMVPLSAQQLVDCSTITGNYGCSGGSLRNSLKYLERAGGLMAADYYPYTAQDSTCKYQPHLRVVNISSWAILPARDERALEAAVATTGPIAVSLNASPKTFQLYHSGVYDDPNCEDDRVNHAMLVVGYTKKEWILKNWWGDKWGEKGYMRLEKNKNRCGIANYAAYARIYT